MNINVGIHFNFEVSQEEFRLIVKALKDKGGRSEMLAAELEAMRAKHFSEIARRFSVQAHSKNEGEK